MTLVWIAYIASTLATVGLLVAWLVVIVRRGLKVEHPPPKLDYGWIAKIYRESFAIIRRCSWILLLPLAAAVLEFIGSLPARYAAVMSSSTHAGFVSRGLFEKLQATSSIIIYTAFLSFVSAIGSLKNAAFSPFRSSPVAAICLFAGMVFFLRPGILSGPIHDQIRKKKWRKQIGVALGLGSLVLLILHIHSWPDHVISSSHQFPSHLIAFPVETFFMAALLSLMQAVGEGKEMTIIETFSRIESCFLPLLYFGLILYGLSLFVLLPHGLLNAFVIGDSDAGRSWAHPSILALPQLPILFAVLVSICFVPVIVVNRGGSIVSALDQCIDLWARHPRSAAIFVIFSALILTVPGVLQPLAQIPFSAGGWARHFVFFLVSCLMVAAGTFVMCSMVVFYNMIRASEENIP